MVNYPGRFTQQMWTKNFGGIDSKATVLNIGDNEAADITNWNIGLSGAITRRDGTAPLVTIGDNANPQIVWWSPFYDENGDEKYAAIAKDASGDLDFFDCDTVGGTYTNRGATSMTLSGSDAYKYIHANWRGCVIVANGTDQPVYGCYGQTVEGLKDASLLDPPTGVVAYGFNDGGVTTDNSSDYAVSAVTARGETPVAYASKPGTINGAGARTKTVAVGDLGINDYNSITWNPVDGAIAYRIYFANAVGGRNSYQGANIFSLVSEVPSTVTQYDDNQSALPAVYNGALHPQQTVNGAYRTWTDWETNGWPKGFCIVARGRDERAFAWRDNYVWASALNNPLDWLALNDAFAFSVDGGTDKTITGIASLYEYILIFTRTQCFVYTGASAQDITLQKVIGRGCVSHHSIVNVEGDVYFWSDYGPTSFKRIMSGADISTSTDFNKRIQNQIFTDTNVDEWRRIHGYRYIPENRVVWAVPAPTGTSNSIAYVFQFDVNGWSKYDNWQFTHCGIDAAYGVYGVREPDANGANALWNLMTGNDDNGTAITASYKTGWYDMRSWDTRKRLIFTDVICDRSVGNYTFSITWSWDYGIQTSLPITCTQTTTDGCTIETTSSTTTEHRVFADGIGSAFQLEFISTAKLPCKIIGWRPEVRGKGVRK